MHRMRVTAATPPRATDRQTPVTILLGRPGRYASGRGRRRSEKAIQADGRRTVSATITGTDKIHGKDSAMSMKLDMAATSTTPASSTVNDSVDVGGFSYARTDGGAWSKTAKKSDTTITSVISQVGLVDKGVESHFNQQLHRLESTKPVPASLMFSDTTGVTNPNLTLTFWTKDDGTPAGMTMAATFTQVSSDSTGDVTMSLDVSFNSLSGVTVEAPSV
jgi:hypothetical protein